MAQRSSQASRTKHFINLAPADAEEFSAAVREAFPNIAFIDANYSRKVVDWDATLESKAYRTSMRNPGAMEIVVAKPRQEWIVTHYEGLHVPGNWQVQAWLEPPGWVPDWYQHPISNWPEVRNAPVTLFRYQRPEFRTTRVQGPFHDPPEIEEEGERIRLCHGALLASWDKGDRERQRQVGKVWRVFEKLSTNKYSTVDPDTFEIISRVEKRGWNWIGFHALEWASQHPRHFIGDDMKPVDWEPPD